MSITLKDILEALNSAWPIAVTVLIACAGVLAAHAYDLPYVTGLPGWILAALFLAGAFAAGSLIARLIQAAIAGCRWVLKLWRTRKYRRVQVAWLYDLPEDEHELMAYLFSENKQAFAYHLGEHRFVPLVSKGLVVPATGPNIADAWPHIIPDHVWDAMKAKPDLFRFDPRKENPLRWMGY